jgi:hypothetical protein
MKTRWTPLKSTTFITFTIAFAATITLITNITITTNIRRFTSY